MVFKRKGMIGIELIKIVENKNILEIFLLTLVKYFTQLTSQNLKEK